MTEEAEVIDMEPERALVHQEGPTLPVPQEAMSMTQMAQQRPQALQAFIKAQKEAAIAVRAACFSLTEPEEWVLNKDKDGNVTGLIKSAGATRVARMLLGLEIKNLRDADGNRVSSVQTYVEDGVTVSYIIADVVVGIFNNLNIEGLRAERRSSEQFIGRDTVGNSDLKSSAYTLLTTKAVREIIGWKSVPERVLQEAGLNTKRCTFGHGFGSSHNRQQAQETGADAGDLQKKAKHLWDRMLAEADGNEQTAMDILRTCSSFEIDGKTISARDWQHLIRKGTAKWMNSTKAKFEKGLGGE